MAQHYFNNADLRCAVPDSIRGPQIGHRTTPVSKDTGVPPALGDGLAQRAQRVATPGPRPGSRHPSCAVRRPRVPSAPSAPGGRAQEFCQSRKGLSIRLVAVRETQSCSSTQNAARALAGDPRLGGAPAGRTVRQARSELSQDRDSVRLTATRRPASRSAKWVKTADWGDDTGRQGSGCRRPGRRARIQAGIHGGHAHSGLMGMKERTQGARSARRRPTRYWGQEVRAGMVMVMNTWGQDPRWVCCTGSRSGR